MHKQFLIAVGSGLVSCLLLAAAAASGGSTYAVFLIFLAPLPIAIAGFGWGWLLSAIGAAIAFGLLTAISSLPAGLIHLVAFGLPITLAVYYLLLSRDYTTPGGQQRTEWFPVGHVLFGIACLAGLIGVAALLMAGAELQTHMERAADRLIKAGWPTPGSKEAAKDALVKLLTVLFPSAFAVGWMWIILFSLWMGARVAHISGLLERPWPNVSMIKAPSWFPAILALAVIGTIVLDGTARNVASAFASTIFLAYALVGLAIIHNITWKNPFRPLLLFLLYVAIAVFNPVTLALAALALIEPLFTMRNPYNGGLITRGDPPDETN